MKDQPIVSGELNGKKAFFLIDSGSDVTLLNLKDAKKYKFNYRKTILKGYKLSGLDSRNTEEILVAYNANLFLGTRKMESCYKVFDLSNIVDSIGRSTGIWINGIIGSDLMKRYNFKIDYGTSEISFKYFTNTSRVTKTKTCL